MNMAPLAETNVVGRHGTFGVEVLPHDLPVDKGLPIESSYAQMVDEMDKKLEILLFEERRANVGRRNAQIAMSETVTLEEPSHTDVVESQSASSL